MADYVSSLTGPQMDAALMDMALHQSEAFAVGTRDGIDVTPGDVAYHNNSKYYAQQGSIYASQSSSHASSAESSASSASTSANNAEADAERAEDAADRAEQIVGGQFVSYGGDQGLSDAQKSQARKNIAAGGSNVNLLDNPFFRINQRGATSGTNLMAFIADRWQVSYGSGGVTWSRTNQTVTVQSTSVESSAYLYQNLEPTMMSFLAGKTVTISLMRSDYTILSVTLVVPSSGIVPGTIGLDTDGRGIRYNINVDINRLNIYKSQTALTIRAVKLELGPFSTLANDAPPNYAEELDKCLYYFERIKAVTNLGLGTGIGNGTRLYTPFTIHPKRANPTISYTGTLSIGRAAVETAITGIYTSGTECDYASGHIQLGVNVTNISGTPYRLILLAGGTLDFSSDL